jgi:hypothetical protein
MPRKSLRKIDRAPAQGQSMQRATAALKEHGFTVELLDDATAARDRVKALIPEGASVFTGASETLRLSGIQDDINGSDRYDALRPRAAARHGTAAIGSAGQKRRPHCCPRRRTICWRWILVFRCRRTLRGGSRASSAGR